MTLAGFTAAQYSLLRTLNEVSIAFPDGSVHQVRVLGLDYPPSVKWTEKPEVPLYAIYVDYDDVPVGAAAYGASSTEANA